MQTARMAATHQERGADSDSCDPIAACHDTRWIRMGASPPRLGEVCIILVGVRGLEPPTSASRTLRASRLRYTPVTST
jgi:hypothetical protein